jgi:hypothetical protein
VGSKTFSSVSGIRVGGVGVAVTVLVTVRVVVVPGAVVVTVVPGKVVPGRVVLTVVPGRVVVAVVPGRVVVAVVPGRVVVAVAVWVIVVVSGSPAQAASRTVEPRAAPPTSRPASFRKSRLDNSPDFFFFLSSVILFI